ncbi:hypothetical protein [Streptomyces sp. SID3212]|uniref:RICIN domain-containing protein n=1 Tax=unclassified Streptomyces TaxID=2593676 RepID=UPI00136F344C|nr:hypothetical protein [Streptomyces sp. SID3212]MYV54587.1 hypothetical protein [Streptomyces sp. SID3212]
MTQNLDFAPAAVPLSTVRFRNVDCGKCLLPYHSSLNNGANVVQWDRDSTDPAHSWVGSGT